MIEEKEEPDGWRKRDKQEIWKFLRMNDTSHVGRSSSWVAERCGRKKREEDRQTHVAGDSYEMDMRGERLLVPSPECLWKLMLHVLNRSHGAVRYSDM